MSTVLNIIKETDLTESCTRSITISTVNIWGMRFLGFISNLHEGQNTHGALQHVLIRDVVLTRRNLPETESCSRTNSPWKSEYIRCAVRSLH